MTSSAISRRDIGLRSARGPVLLAVMLSTGLVAIDTTILATAVPSLVDDLGGFTQFPWLFSVYLLTTAVTTPLYGKLADVLGRKPVMLLGIALFVGGSVLCGFAWSMTALIVFRAIQGVGAGAVQPMGMTIVGDLYSMAERAKVQGYIASVWAIASFVGPTLGGVFSDYLSWRWIFFVNVPIGVVAVLMLVRRFDERVERHPTQVDWAGAFLLTVGGILLLLGLLEGGQRWAWDSLVGVGIFVVAAVLLAGFVVAERFARQPVLPLWVFRRRVLNAANGGALLVGCVMLGLTSYVPLYAQHVLGHSALVAGLALAGMTIGWPIAASQVGRLYLTVGFKATVLLGAAVTVVGNLLLLTVGRQASFWHLTAACFVVGVGLGLVTSPSVVAAQSSVDWRNRGVATGANMFARAVGSAVGIAVFGAVANGEVASRVGGSLPPLEQLPADVLAPALHTVFVIGTAVSAALLITSFLMPRRVQPVEAS